MVLDDIPYGSGLLVEGAAALDAYGLGDGDLDMVHGIPVPHPFEQRVPEPEHQDVLDRLLPKVVVDAEHLGLAERFMNVPGQVFRGSQVPAERLLHHQPRALDEACFLKAADGARDRRGRYRQVHQPLFFGGALPQVGAALFVQPDEGEPGGEARPQALVEASTREFLHRFPGELAETFVAQVRAGQAYDPAALRSQLRRLQVVQGGQELAAGEVSRRPDDNDVLRGRPGEAHAGVTGWPPNSWRRAAMTLAAKDSSWRERNRS